MFNKNKKPEKNSKMSDNYFKNKKINDELLFEKKKRHLLKQFFIFWIFVMLVLVLLSLYYHSFGIMIFLIPLFLTYIRLSGNNEHWKENFDIIMSNKFALLFMYAIYFLTIMIILIIIYGFFKLNFNFHLDFMDYLIKGLIMIFSKH